MKELTELNFLAQIINQSKSEKEGYDGATLWLVTNSERQAECLKEAQQLFEEWKQKELSAEKQRNSLTASIKIYKVGGEK